MLFFAAVRLIDNSMAGDHFDWKLLVISACGKTSIFDVFFVWLGRSSQDIAIHVTFCG